MDTCPFYEMEFKVVLVDIPPPHHGVVLRIYWIRFVCMWTRVSWIFLLIAYLLMYLE